MAQTDAIYKHYEELRPEWDGGIIGALYQQSAHLADACVRFSCSGESYKMETRGTTTVHRIEHRYQHIGNDEMTYGQREIYPVGYYATLNMSTRDLIRQGSLPVGISDMHQCIMEAAAPIPDQVFLGVTPDSTHDGNCVVNATTDKSYYYGTDGSTSHAGTAQGLLGANVIKDGSLGFETFAQQPYIGSAVASNYSSYSESIAGLSPELTTVVPVNYAGRATVSGNSVTPVDSGLTIEKLQYVIFCLRRRKIYPERESVWMAITPAQVDDLMSIDEFRNSDYGGHCLQQGIPPTFMGIHFLVTVDCPIVNIGTTASPKWVRSCPVWVKTHAAFGVWEDPFTQFTQIPDEIDHYACTVVFSYGSGRRRKEGVICVHCDEWELHKWDTPINAGGGGGGTEGGGSGGSGAQGS